MIGSGYDVAEHGLDSTKGGAIAHAGRKLALMIIASPAGAFDQVSDFKIEFEFSVFK